MTIEGVPEGWELVRIGTPALGDYFIDIDGKPYSSLNHSRTSKLPIIRKIEKPERYRPFANAEEFKPFFEKLIRVVETVNKELFLDADDVGDLMRVIGYNESSVCTWAGWCIYKTAFDAFVFEDGSPFGIEVTE
jgi:hypothetical protein